MTALGNPASTMFFCHCYRSPIRDSSVEAMTKPSETQPADRSFETQRCYCFDSVGDVRCEGTGDEGVATNPLLNHHANV